VIQRSFRALNPSSKQDDYRKRGEQLNQLTRELEQAVALEAASSTEERAQELRTLVSSEEPKTLKDACSFAHIHDALSRYSKNKLGEVNKS
jgi:hypothetical protein